MCSSACAAIYRNWASRSGCCLPWSVLALPCRLNPSSRSRSPTVSAETRCPWPVSSWASLRVDFVVQRNGDIGSPRSSGSTSASSADRSPGSTSAVFLRPPPERRTLPSGASPASSSSMPLRTVVSLFPAARATVRIPPCPGSGPRLPSADAAGVHLDAGTTPRTSRRVDHVPLPACPYHDNERSSVIKQHVDSLHVLTGGAESPNVW